MATLAAQTRTAFRSCVRQCRSRRPSLYPHRTLSTAPLGTEHSHVTPWFMDPADSGAKPLSRVERNRPPHLSIGEDVKPKLAPLPAEIPASSPLALLHSALQDSPHLEPGTLLVREPIDTMTGPPLPLTLPKGRRKRGGTYFGEGLGETMEHGGIWSWVLIAQVRSAVGIQ